MIKLIGEIVKFTLVKILGVFALVLIMQSCLTPGVTTTESQTMNIIPKPQAIEILNGKFVFGKTTSFWIDDKISSSSFFGEYLKNLIPGLQPGTPGNVDIEFSMEPSADIPKEGYELTIKSSGIQILAQDEPGLFYAIQTLRQLLPISVENSDASISGHAIPATLIKDYPRFGWRGMHLDVSRHFFPAEFIKQYIDMIALHKMNTFHWHLTDDNGWRLEIKKYPKLTEICAWRVDREHEDWRKWSPIEPGEKATYGGFYTQDEVRDIVAYAAERQITVVPEIEMPGHSSELFAAYPELSCRGERLDVRPGGYWPNKDILCAGNDDVFTLLEGVIDEVVEMFPAKYIHIGGDEATKTYWEECPKCQARIKDEGLANEHELQSWFIQKMEKYVLAKGKRIIGWNEILEGGLAPEATVMSWQGESGGIKAAKAGHDVIMTPYSHVYFDYYQGDSQTEPQAIGGYLPLKTVYGYEPVPEELTEDEEKFVLGSQANLWTEFVKTTSHAEYMVLPRMTALSEVIWSDKDSKDWLDFRNRLNYLLPRFEALDWNYSRGSFVVEILPGRTENSKNIRVDLISEQIDMQLRYTMDGSDPTAESPLYEEPLSLNEDALVRASIFDGDTRAGRIIQRGFAFHHALDAKGVYKMPYSRWYKAGGDQGLLDGILGSENHKDGTWQGFQVDDLELTIDLGEERTIFKTEMNFLQSTNSWIFMPEYIEVSLSRDGENWEVVDRVDNEVNEKDENIGIHRLSAGFPSQKTRYVKVLAKNRGICPDWHQGAGDKAWIMCDEVIVR